MRAVPLLDVPAMTAEVREDVDEQEDEDADGEHREGDARPGAERLQPPDGQAQIDGEAGERSQQCGLLEGHPGPDRSS